MSGGVQKFLTCYNAIIMHEHKVGFLQSELVKSSRVALSRQDGHSNLTRESLYKENRRKLPLEMFDEILEITEDRVVVEPRVTFDRLVKATLAKGLVPPVVPEFKRITVGGAYSGGSLESSSGVYGQFSDTVLELTVLLGSGKVLRASPLENSDLFYALSGSFGTLGILLSLTIRLIPALKNVCVGKKGSFHETLLLEEGPIDLPACMTNDPVTFKTTPFSDWYYHRAPQSLPFVMPLDDYLFRYDPGAFWMASTFQGASWIFRHLFGGKTTPSFTTPKEPPSFLRPFFSAARLYKSLHALPKNWFANNFIVQDFYLPEEHVNEFISHLKIRPLWLCPVKPTATQQIFSPHSLPVSKLYDVGVYGLDHEAEKTTRQLEKLCTALGGRKMLYAYNYYTLTQFWQIYNKSLYEELRTKYEAAPRLPSIEEKVLASYNLSHV